MDTSNVDTGQPTQEETQTVEEKRYKDVQAAYTKATQDNKAVKEQLDKMAKENEQYKKVVIELYNKNQEEDPEAESYVSKREVDEVKQMVNASTALNKFRLENPDLIQYEELVNFNIQKTDPLATPEDRLKEAAKLTKEFIKTERKKAVDESKSKEAKKQKQEAEASGLETTIKQDEKPEKEETDQDWINLRRKVFNARAGY